ncbi:unnamed protein product [Closterium sp. Naga37s-1]|nr:unnamed protein product [Closterium sp. Naga37s-1]
MAGKAEAGPAEAEQADRKVREDQVGGKKTLEGVGGGERIMAAMGATAGPGEQGAEAAPAGVVQADGEGGGEDGGGQIRCTIGALLPLVDHFQARVSRAWQIRGPPVASALLQSAARLPPLLRTSATSGALLAGGDVCAQCIELSSAGDAARIRDARGEAAQPSNTEQASDTRGDEASSLSYSSSAISRDGSGNAAAGPAPAFNAARSLRMMVYGACIYGPALHVWYPLVERAAPGKSLGATAGKVLASQALLNPCLIAAVFAFNYAWTGQLHALKDKYRRDFLRTWRRGWHFWLPASFASFRLVPLHLRPAYSSACSLLWNCHLSMVTMHQVRAGERKVSGGDVRYESALVPLYHGLDLLAAEVTMQQLRAGERCASPSRIQSRVKLNHAPPGAPLPVGFLINLNLPSTRSVAGRRGGLDNSKPYWRCYYPNTQAVIYVVDSTDVDRIGTSKEEFHAILDEEELKEAVVLVYANKQDLPGAMSEVQVSDALGLHKIKSRPWAIYKTSAVKGDGLFEGLDWLTINGQQPPPRSHLVGRVGEFEGELNYYLPLRLRTRPERVSLVTRPLGFPPSTVRPNGFSLSPPFSLHPSFARAHPERVNLVTRPLGFPLSTARLANVFLHFFHHLPSDNSHTSSSSSNQIAGSVSSAFVDSASEESGSAQRRVAQATDSAGRGDGSRSQARFDEACSHEQDVGIHGAHALQMMRLEDVYLTDNGFALNRTHLFVRSGCPHFPGSVTYDKGHMVTYDAGHMVHELPAAVFNWAHQPSNNFYHFLIEIFPLFLVAAPLMPSPLRQLPVLVRGGQVQMYEQLGAPLIGIPLDQMRLLPTSGNDLFHANVVYQPIFQNCHHPSQSLWRLMRRRHLLHPSGIPLFNPDWTLRNHRSLSPDEARSLPSDWVVVLAKRPKGKKRAILNVEEVEAEVVRWFGRERVVVYDGSLPILQDLNSHCLSACWLHRLLLENSKEETLQHVGSYKKTHLSSPIPLSHIPPTLPLPSP